jgi:GNAT superfamily N-acetyltransferase
MIDGIHIRLATRTDQDAIKAIRATAHWSLEFTSFAFTDMEMGRRVIYVAECDARPVGTAQLVLSGLNAEQTDGRSMAHLSDLAVLPAYRRRGIASLLVRYVEDVARERGFRVLTLEVDEDKPETEQMYARRGYAYCGRTISPWGTWLHAMRKPLDAVMA